MQKADRQLQYTHVEDQLRNIQSFIVDKEHSPFTNTQRQNQQNLGPPFHKE